VAHPDAAVQRSRGPPLGDTRATTQETRTIRVRTI